MEGYKASLGALALCSLLASCGGGGGGSAGAGGGGAGGGSWLTFAPAAVNLSVFPNNSKAFSVTANSSRTIAQQVNIGVIDSKGVIKPQVKVTAHTPTQYFASMSTNPALAPGVYTGNFEVRVCYDANPLVCSQPVDGSPWQVPYTIKVIDPASMSYSNWEAAQTSPGFSDNFALSYSNGSPFVVAAGFYTGVMETWTSADVGSTWTKVTTNSPTPLTKNFALATDNTAIYMSGGQSIATFGAALGLYQSDVWKFDGTTWQSQTAVAPFVGRERHVMAKVGGTLYVAGGRNAAGPFHDIWRSVDEGVTWSKVSDTLPAALGTVTCALEWQNTLLLVGNGVATSTDGVTWNVRSNYPSTFPFGSTQCAVLNGKLFINASNDLADAVSTSDLTNWQLERSTVAAPAPGMAPIGGRLMVTTGAGTSQRTTFRTVP